MFHKQALDLPARLEPLTRLAGNLYWTWNRHIRELFETIDPAAWTGLEQNPVALLQKLSRGTMEELERDEAFLGRMNSCLIEQENYIHSKDTWFQRTYDILHRNYLIAYFSAEFGVASFLRTYSGGLGILAGDHLKSASDLGIPLVGVGLFYKRGYFSQSLDSEGWQIETYPENDFSNLPVEPVLAKDSDEPLILSVHIDKRQVRVRAWKVQVGRVLLYLLDTNLPRLNSKEDCEITSELYGGDHETRIKQEIVLGFGGARLLRAIGLRPTIFHMNEGHSAFVTLERIKEFIDDSKGHATFTQAMDVIKNSDIFTTHTPVPAGIDIFGRELFQKYLDDFPKRVGISFDDLFSLGQENKDSDGFSMAVLAIHLSLDINAVSQLHRDVARKIWEPILEEENPEVTDGSRKFRNIGSITNGIHVSSWVSESMSDIFDEYLGKNWVEFTNESDVWSGVTRIPENVLWEARCRERRRLVEYVRQSLPPTSNVQILDPDALTIGFARRFATYKRATLLFSFQDRLERLLKDSSRPIQFVFAGKAHPRDFEGKRLIQDIFRHAKSFQDLLGTQKLVFLSDYNICTARNLVQGVDVWLNNPRRPLEACGTSGMKVLPNGGLNLSVLDGWWDEAYSPEVGWAIGSKETKSDPHEQAIRDAQSLYDVLEHSVIPEFYERQDGIPSKWIQKMKSSISTLSPRFNTRRMVMEYAQRFYFKSDGDFVRMLNRSELGADLLDRAMTDWDQPKEID